MNEIIIVVAGYTAVGKTAVLQTIARALAGAMPEVKLSIEDPDGTPFRTVEDNERILAEKAQKGLAIKLMEVPTRREN